MNRTTLTILANPVTTAETMDIQITWMTTVDQARQGTSTNPPVVPMILNILQMMCLCLFWILQYDSASLGLGYPPPPPGAVWADLVKGFREIV